jgi:zinc transport system substrate-binding protein
MLINSQRASRQAADAAILRAKPQRTQRKFKISEDLTLNSSSAFFASLRLCVILFSVLVLTVSCTRHEKRDGVLIAVSIPPQAWFVSQIAGDKANAMILAGPGQNPHNFEPSPKQIQSLSAAGAWILSGTEFEISLLPKISSLFPKLLIVDGTKGVHFRTLAENETHDDEYSLLEIDRHTWLGREPAKILAAHIRDTLSFIDNENKEYYFQRYDNLIYIIDDEFDRLKILLEPLKGSSVFVYHPSFGYFLDEFGIRQEAVETGGKEPGPRVLNRLIVKLNDAQASGYSPGAIFVQPQFSTNAARTLASSTGVVLIELDPLAQDWLENIQYMGKTLEMSMLNKTALMRTLP